MTASITKQLDALRREYALEKRHTAGHEGHIQCGCDFTRMHAITKEIHALLDDHPRLDKRLRHMRPLR